MDPQSCAILAVNAGYSVFGLQDGSLCFAGNSLADATQYGTSDDCNMACLGTFQGQICGA